MGMTMSGSCLARMKLERTKHVHLLYADFKKESKSLCLHGGELDGLHVHSMLVPPPWLRAVAVMSKPAWAARLQQSMMLC